jgi:hypothetical protein
VIRPSPLRKGAARGRLHALGGRPANARNEAELKPVVKRHGIKSFAEYEAVAARYFLGDGGDRFTDQGVCRPAHGHPARARRHDRCEKYSGQRLSKAAWGRCAAIRLGGCTPNRSHVGCLTGIANLTASAITTTAQHYHGHQSRDGQIRRARPVLVRVWTACVLVALTLS